MTCAAQAFFKALGVDMETTFFLPFWRYLKVLTGVRGDGACLLRAIAAICNAGGTRVSGVCGVWAPPGAAGQCGSCFADVHVGRTHLTHRNRRRCAPFAPAAQAHVTHEQLRHDLTYLLRYLLENLEDGDVKERLHAAFVVEENDPMVPSWVRDEPDAKVQRLKLIEHLRVSARGAWCTRVRMRRCPARLGAHHDRAGRWAVLASQRPKTYMGEETLLAASMRFGVRILAYRALRPNQPPSE